jgi:transcriptional regulator with XRE-family HTH domain
MLSKITPIDLHLAKKLRHIRTSCGVSQDELGELSGLTFQQIQKYETAKNRISASRLFEFSQILQRPITDFFAQAKADRMYYNYDFEKEKDLKRKSDKSQRALQNLIAAFNRIEDDKARKQLISLAEILAKPKRKVTKHSYS